MHEAIPKLRRAAELSEICPVDHIGAATLIRRVRALLRKRSAAPSKRTRDLSEFLLAELREFCLHIDGHVEAFDEHFKGWLDDLTALRACNRVHGHLQTMLMSNYEERLYEFYVGQQYLLMLTFMSYPHWMEDFEAAYLDPFHYAADRTDQIQLLDLGAGVPFGLIERLRSDPDKVHSVCLVDLDLIHTQFVEFVLKRLNPELDLCYLRMKDCNATPPLGEREFNLYFGKDIFEHLHEPDKHLRQIMESSTKKCHCVFDFRDHGERTLQHVTPDVRDLQAVMIDLGFSLDRKLCGLSIFAR